MSTYSTLRIIAVLLAVVLLTTHIVRSGNSEYITVMRDLGVFLAAMRYFDPGATRP